MASRKEQMVVTADNLPISFNVFNKSEVVFHPINVCLDFL